MKILSIPSRISDAFARRYFARCRRIAGCANCAKTGEFRCLPCEDKWNESYCNLTDDIISVVVIVVCAVLIRWLMAGWNWLLTACRIAPHQRYHIYGCFVAAGLLLLIAVCLKEFKRDLLRRLLPAGRLDATMSTCMLASFMVMYLGPAILTLLTMEKGPTWDCWLGPIFLSMLVAIVCGFTAAATALAAIAVYQIGSTLPSLLRRHVA